MAQEIPAIVPPALSDPVVTYPTNVIEISPRNCQLIALTHNRAWLFMGPILPEV